MVNEDRIGQDKLSKPKKKKKQGPGGSKLVARNKKALWDFSILDSFEAGIMLWGSEVKSVRDHRVNLKDSYARIRSNELFAYNIHISPYMNGDDHLYHCFSLLGGFSYHSNICFYDISHIL